MIDGGGGHGGFTIGHAGETLLGLDILLDLIFFLVGCVFIFPGLGRSGAGVMVAGLAL
jgi:hypothetical protein